MLPNLLNRTAWRATCWSANSGPEGGNKEVTVGQKRFVEDCLSAISHSRRRMCFPADRQENYILPLGIDRIPLMYDRGNDLPLLAAVVRGDNHDLNRPRMIAHGLGF